MHSIWAVARNTLAQTLRMKIAAVVVLLLLILLPLMSMVMGGDDTLLGKLQTFTSYGLGLISFLLCILTIAISTFTLSNDIKRKHIFLVITKPIRHWQLILGKLVAIVLLNVILLGIFSGILYAFVLLIPRMVDATEGEKLRAKAEFFTSRVGIKPSFDTELLSKRAKSHYDELEKAGQIPEQMSYARIIGELFGQEMLKAKKVDPGEVKQWEFENVRVKDPGDPNALLFVRYQYKVTVTPPDEKIYGMWKVGDLRQLKGGVKVKTPIYDVDRAEAIRVTREFAIPVAAIADDGTLGIAFYNNPALNRTTIIPEEFEVLYQTGGFTENFVRAVLMILVRLIFLSVLGISLTTWLSFPVAILVCVSVFFVGLTNGFILDAIDSLGATAGIIYSLTVKPLLWLLPQFDGDYNPNGYIVDGRTIRWTFLATTAIVTLFVKGLLMLFAGMLIFSRREVAKTVS
ncbi:MAG: hypothetical protein B6I25_03285 [Planctomycetales bacterium 4572_13]|nr:MAG: hypothetical protein B6I25_03285 [Planctomycetales bacterium 4572_13]